MLDKRGRYEIKCFLLNILLLWIDTKGKLRGYLVSMIPQGLDIVTKEYTLAFILWTNNIGKEKGVSFLTRGEIYEIKWG